MTWGFPLGMNRGGNLRRPAFKIIARIHPRLCGRRGGCVDNDRWKEMRQLGVNRGGDRYLCGVRTTVYRHVSIGGSKTSGDLPDVFHGFAPGCRASSGTGGVDALELGLHGLHRPKCRREHHHERGQHRSGFGGDGSPLGP